jgi:hypothetical protein
MTGSPKAENRVGLASFPGGPGTKWEVTMSFLDKAKQAAKKAGAEAQKQANVAKLTLELKNVRDDMRAKLTSMGELALKLVRDDKLKAQSFNALVKDVEGLEKRIGEIEGHIAEVKAQSSDPT